MTASYGMTSIKRAPAEKSRERFTAIAGLFEGKSGGKLWIILVVSVTEI